MKPKVLVLPAISLLIAGFWIIPQRKSIASLQASSEQLWKRIASHPSTQKAESETGKPSREKSAKDKSGIDWKEIADQLSAMQYGNGPRDFRATLRLQQRLQEMSPAELLATLDEIAALDLPPAAKTTLEQMLIPQLIEKDPQAALNRFIDRLNDNRGMMAYTLSPALKGWAEKDPAAATAWFDQQIAAGKFASKSLDGKSQPRLLFEGALIGVMLSLNPEGAATRLSAMPEDQRSDILRRAGNVGKEESQAAYAKLVRDQLKPGQQTSLISSPASQMISRGEELTKVSAYLERIKATPEERAATVNTSVIAKVDTTRAKKFSHEDIDALREWATVQSPATVDHATGIAIFQGLKRGKLEFSEAADLAVQYQQSTGNDEVLGAFLESDMISNKKEQARELAAKISDPTRRNKILQHLK